MPRILLETVCCSPSDCLEAEAGGADRIELCSALGVGGLTPSLGVVLEARRRTSLPLVCMIRPRPGPFGYAEPEFESMRRDVELLRAHGAAGVVFGVLDDDCAVDVPRTRALVEAAGPVETVFHRAFDLAADPLAALDALVEAGVTRVLTSGRERTAAEGAALIAALLERAAGRIDVMPGGGIRAGTVAPLLQRTGARAVHAGPVRQARDRTGRANPRLSFGEPGAGSDDFPLTDRAAVRALRRALDDFAAASP